MLRNGFVDMDNARILDIGNSYGVMNTAAVFSPKGMTLDERRVDFLRRRLLLARENKFDGYKMFMAD